MDVVYTTIALLAVLLNLQGVYSDCAANSPVFGEVPEDQYDRKYSRIDVDGKRPLGFKRGIVPYGNPDHTNHCVRVRGVADKYVEIIFETVPTMTLCLKVDGGTTACQERRYYNCLKTTSDSMLIEFTCEKSQGCSESDVTFWYRLTKGPPPKEDTEGMWCYERDVEYPESLAPSPPGVVPPKADSTTPSPSGASMATVSMAMAPTLVTMAFVLSIFH